MSKPNSPPWRSRWRRSKRPGPLARVKNISDIYKDLKTAAKIQNLENFYVLAAKQASAMFGEQITPAEVRQTTNLTRFSRTGKISQWPPAIFKRWPFRQAESRFRVGRCC